MNLLSPEELKMLIVKRGEPCMSLFLPGQRTAGEGKQRQIRFKNLLKQAEDDLLALGAKAPEARSFLAPASNLLQNPLFLRKQIDSLALFASRDDLHHFSLPVPVEELIVVSDRYHLKPLFPLLGQRWHFYVLSLSQNQPRLFHGTINNLSELEKEKLPRGIAEALNYDEPERQVRFRSAGASGERGGMVSGHGAELDDTKDNLLKYFRIIDRGLRDILKDEKAPLVVACVDYLMPIYKEANTYPYLVEGGTAGNPKGMSQEELHKQAWQLVKPYFERTRLNALALYRQSVGTGLASAEPGDILPAARHGRVGYLFVNPVMQQWGVFDRDRDLVKLQVKKESASDDLLDLAAVETYLNGGEVFTLTSGEMPEGKPLAAVFRY